jgi:hypothetical protein
MAAAMPQNYIAFGTLGVIPLRLPLIHIATVDPVLAIISLFLLETLLKFFALLAAVAHKHLLLSV